MLTKHPVPDGQHRVVCNVLLLAVSSVAQSREPHKSSPDTSFREFSKRVIGGMSIHIKSSNIYIGAHEWVASNVNK
jgi:hypothetical protein